jgi:ABC-type polysaccharide/polyol phosphate export permease
MEEISFTPTQYSAIHYMRLGAAFWTNLQECRKEEIAVVSKEMFVTKRLYAPASLPVYRIVNTVMSIINLNTIGRKHTARQ